MEPLAATDPLASTAAVVLATAASPGTAETLAREPVGGSSLLGLLVDRLEGLPLVVVVVRSEDDADLVDGRDNVVVVVDPEWEEAAASLRAGLDFVEQSDGIEDAFILSMTSPQIEPAALAQLATARREAGTLVAVPKYRYVRGEPALIARDLWPRFLGAEGDLDLTAVLQAHPRWVTEVRVDFPPPRRIVSRDDLIDVTG